MCKQRSPPSLLISPGRLDTEDLWGVIPPPPPIPCEPDPGYQGPVEEREQSYFPGSQNLLSLLLYLLLLLFSWGLDHCSDPELQKALEPMTWCAHPLGGVSQKVPGEQQWTFR